MSKLLKLSLIYIVVCTTQIPMYSQCPTLSFSGQSDVDSFIINYPDCDSLLSADFSFGWDPWSEEDSITNFDGFRNIKYIDEGVHLSGLHSLSDISGLNNVETINGNLFVSDLHSMDIFDGFKNLKEIKGSLTIQGTNFDSISGFGNLEKIDHVLVVSYNSSLANISELGPLDNFYRILIYNNLKLNNLNFLNSVTTITEQVSINGNPSISNLDGLENLTSAEYIIIDNNALLNSISSLKNLERLGSTTGSTLRIKNNPKLTSLAGLEKLDVTTVSKMTIASNPLLSYCQLENVCQYVSSPFNDATVIGNDTDCDIRPNLVDQCTSSFNLSEGAYDQCNEIATVDISADNSNNNELIHIYDEFDNILCSINAQGNDLGSTDFHLYNSTELRVANVPYANRNFTITPEQQPTTDVLVRLYYSDEDINSIIQNDNAVDSFEGMIISKNALGCTSTIADNNDVVIPINYGKTANDIYFIDISIQEFSTFFAHGAGDIILDSDETARVDRVVSPNPTSDKLNISGLSNFDIAMYSIYGDIISLTDRAMDRDFIDVSHLPSGVYILVMKSGQQAESIKFTKI